MLFKILLPIVILIGSIGATIALVANREQPAQEVLIEASLLVEVIQPQRQDAYITVSSQGTVEPRTRTNIVSEVTGRVIEVSPAFLVGGFFRTGDILVKLDDQNYRAAVSRDAASVATAYSLLEQERGQADVAQREWDRMSEQQQNQIRARNLYLRQPQLEEAEARLVSAEADLEKSQADLAKTIIVAPYDGLVSAKSTDIGQFVSTGSAIAEVFAVDYAEVRLPIPENKIQYLNLPSSIQEFSASDEYYNSGPEVELISDIGDRRFHWTGHLTRTEGVLDTRTRVLFSVVQVSDPYNLYSTEHEEPLRIGTYINAEIQGRLLEDVIILPRHTLQANDLVWVADQENRLRSRIVDVITSNGDEVYIRGGLEPGDKVVLTRMENPLNSTLVQTQIQPPLINPVN
ncbi:MAG: efflux transporter periplasmic adaptor subunit [SAR86 cluster bacterium]|uniref:Efflux transporter periplasmic adaptor subunit n=1 Tax=SAR86 cluster bacterium TaxID=2030880 RepID=A0A2A5CAW9_9GAMM|nr:MAG: efflux transporter periplasmic adaptor subunit [SAR86 cluster bacterium]